MIIEALILLTSSIIYLLFEWKLTPSPDIRILVFQTLSDVEVVTTAQLHSAKPEPRFCAGSNPARGVSEIPDGEDL